MKITHRLSTLVLALLLAACGSEPTSPESPELSFLEGSKAGRPPLTVPERLVTRGGEPVPYKLVPTEPEVCDVAGSRVGTEAGRTISSVGDPIRVPVRIFVRDEGIVETVECEPQTDGSVVVDF